MELKQTAVEWIFDKILEEGPSGELRWHLKYDIFKIFEQALAMEKEQHGDTWDMALKQMVERGYVWERAMTDFDDYWEEKSKPSHLGEK